MAACSALLIAGALLLGSAPPALATAEDPGDEPWERFVQRMIDEADQHPHTGQIVVVSFGSRGPSVGEITVVRTADGTVMSDQARSWMVGQRPDETVLADVETGTLFRLGTAQRGVLSVGRLSRNYEVDVEGREPSAVGVEGVVVALTPSGTGTVRERIQIDPETGLVLRRETFADDGEPVRLVVYTALEFGAEDAPDIGSGWIREEVEPIRADVSPRGVDIFRDVGWVVPDRLPGGFQLVDAGAVGDGEGEASSLHLLYSDGLYALSVYEQEGRLDERAAREAGAEPIELGEMGAYRWPGPEPAVITWTADGMTFTAVSDAPPDVLATALTTFPYEAPTRLTDRLRRGWSRAVDVLWPFG